MVIAMEHPYCASCLVLGTEQRRTETTRAPFGTKSNISAENVPRRPEEILQILPLSGIAQVANEECATIKAAVWHATILGQDSCLLSCDSRL